MHLRLLPVVALTFCAVTSLGIASDKPALEPEDILNLW